MKGNITGKIVFILAFVCMSAAQSYGQNKFKPEWNVGVGFGPTFSAVDFVTTTNGSGPLNTVSKKQFHGGLSIRYMSEKNLGLIAELNYSQQGWDQEFSESSKYDFTQLSHTHTLNYIELPILTHIYFGNKVRFVINLGPKISFLMSESEKMSTALSDYIASGNMEPSEMATYQFGRNAETKIDYGIMGGLGLEFRTGIGNFMLEGRYSFGLGDIYNNSKSDYFGRSANRVISARLTYFVKIF